MRVTQEPDVIADRVILTVVVVSIAVTAVGVGVAWALHEPKPSVAGREDTAVMKPQVVPAEVNAMETTFFNERVNVPPPRWGGAKALESYGWVDRDRGLVHIPINRAIELWLERRAAGPQPQEGTP